MGTDLATIEHDLKLLQPTLADLVPANVSVEKIMRTVLVSVERTPKLLQCNRQTVMNAAISAAVLGLEVDGTTGQGFLIPFGSHCQLVIGYKGFNTLAARAGYTINGGAVRDGDDFEFQEGTDGFVRHKRKLGNEAARQIVAVWATATAKGRTPIVVVLSRDQIDAVRDRSQGAKKKDSPWNDAAIGFQAMAEKTAKRRLARSMPMGAMQQAAIIDEAVEERGLPAYINEKGNVVVEGKAHEVEGPEGATEPAPPPITGERPTYSIVRFSGTEKLCNSPEEWRDMMKMAIASIKTMDRVTEFMKINIDAFSAVEAVAALCALDVDDAVLARIEQLKGEGK